MHRNNIKGIQDMIERGEFEDEDPQPYVFDPVKEAATLGGGDMEYESGSAYQRVEHTSGRHALYTPLGSKAALPPEGYTGSRITRGKYVDSGERFVDHTPWQP